MDSICLCDNKYLYICNSNQIINATIKGLFLTYSQNREIKFEKVKINKDIIKSKVKNLNQIVFECSQFCNMGCLYCTYGDNYTLQRKSSSKSISFETARKAVDYISIFIKHRVKKEFTIGFYGGEPLSNFGTLKKIVTYSKKVFQDWNLHFTITTNGTLLSEDIILFFIKYNFTVSISLDGPENNHDSKRLYMDGGGSFQRVVKNLKKIKKIDKDYYTEKIIFSIVYSKDLSLEKLYHFFHSNELVNKNITNFSYVNSADTNYYKKYPYDERRYRNEFEKTIQSIIQKKIEKKFLSPIESDFFNKIASLGRKLESKKFTYLGGACLFDSRIYIDVDGAFHICEKMNNKFPFGDIYNGFDYSKMQKIVRDYVDLIKRNCIDCEVRFLCDRCYINFAKNGTFKMEENFCRKSRKKIKRLEDYIRLKEAGVI